MSFIEILVMFLFIGIWMLTVEVGKLFIGIKLLKNGMNQVVKQSTDAALSGVFKALMKYKLDKENAKAVWPGNYKPEDLKNTEYNGGESDEMSDLR